MDITDVSVPGDEDAQDEAEFDLEATAQSFAACSWKAMHVFEEIDPEGYVKLSAASRKLRDDIIDQMIDAADAPPAVAVTIFAVEFLTMFLAKIVDTARDVPEEIAQKAGMYGVSDDEIFDMCAQGLVEMCKQLYAAGNARAEASDEADEAGEDSKIVAFVPS